MGISKKYLDRSQRTCYFKPEELSRLLQKLVPHIVFAYLMGSARNGTVKQGSDLDLAVFLNIKPNLPLYDKIQDICESIVSGPVRCDVGILNHADPVYRFEALKGRLLFTRNQEIWLTFYSRTCREVEHQMFHYEKQRRYRLEARV